MPSFTFSFADLVSSGPVLKVLIGPSRELIDALGMTVLRPPVVVNAMIDTGAQSTVFSPDIVRRLNIKTVGAVPIITPTTMEPILCKQYHVNVYFSAEVVVENILAAEAPLIGHDYQCLIGRDVLRRCVLVYIGSENQFTLTL